MNLDQLRPRLVLSLLLGIAVVLALALYGNAAALVSTFQAFRWQLLPLILGLTLLNYALRLVKWHFYLRQIGVRIDRRDSAAIFTAGLSMAMTPGKIGEVLKPLLLKLRAGTPLSSSIPVVVAERLTDGIAMIILALGGLLLSHAAWQVLVLSLVLAAGALALLGSARGAGLVLRLSHRVPVLGRRLEHIEVFLRSSRALFTPRNLLVAVALGVVSWSGEGVAFYLVLTGLGMHASFTLAVQATFVLSVSTLVGSLSMLPGGLGAVDASVAGLLALVIHLGRSRAAAATLLIRFCTLWFGVAVGLMALFLFRRRFSASQAATLPGDDYSTTLPNSPAPLGGALDKRG